MFSRINLKPNVTFSLKDKDGNVKKLFQENKLAAFLMKSGILSPKYSKIPFLFGHYADKAVVPNLITNAGLAGVASRLNGSGAEAAFTYVAIGTGTTAAAVTDTTLETEISTDGGSRAAATCTRTTTDVTNDTAQMVATYTFSGSFAVTESGIFNDASSGTMLARRVFSAYNVTSGDQLTITWTIDCD